MLSTLEYMALSKLAYANFDSSLNNKTITQLMGMDVLSGMLGSPELSVLNDPNSSLSDWVLIASTSDSATGFQGAAFQGPSGQIVFSFRGTDPSGLADYETDLGLAIPTASTTTGNQLLDANNFFNSVMSNNTGADYSFTGWSLGGAIAQYMTYVTAEQGHSVTFNAPGIGQQLINAGITINPSDYNDSITDYVNQNDLIGAYGIQLGTTIYQQDIDPNRLYGIDPLAAGQILAVQVAVDLRLIDSNQASIILSGILALATPQTVSIISDQLIAHPAHGLDQMLIYNSATHQYEMTNTASSSTMGLLANILTGDSLVINNTISELGNIGAAIDATATQVILNVINTATATSEQLVAIANEVEQILANAGSATLNWISSLLSSIFGDTAYATGTSDADGMSGVVGKKNVIYGLAGNDTIYGQSESDQLFGGNGNDTLYGSPGNDIVDGGDGNDIVMGDNGDDTVYGGAGNDIVVGDSYNPTSTWIQFSGTGNDTLIGGTGNDTLYGGAGNDTYVFSPGDGQDVIDDFAIDWIGNSSPGGFDTLAFQAGIDPNNVIVTRDDYNLYLSVANSTDSVTIKDYFTMYPGSGIGTIEQITFADGTAWSEATIRDRVRYIDGTSAGETIYGFNDQGDIVSAGDGNDTIETFAGDDLILAGAGNDTVIGDSGNDTIYGDTGNDTLTGSSGDDIISGEDGDDTIYGDSFNPNSWVPFSDTGNDTISGGKGNDHLYGGAGNDTYIFNSGDGQDTIGDYTSTYYGSAAGGGFDVLAFQAGIDPNNVIVTRDDYNLYLNISGTTDSVTIQSYFPLGAVGAIEQITFADGTTWSESLVREKARYINGTSASETIYGFADQADIVSAGDGNDTIETFGGNDLIHAGAGNDIISGDNENDTIYGESGNDTIYGDYINSYSGSTSGNGDDTLIGGAGNDMLYGGAGNDTYVFNAGDGQDVIYDYNLPYAYGSPTNGGFDTISFQDGINPSDILVKRTYTDLLLTNTNTSDSVTIQNFFDYYSSGVVEQVTFADGTVWDEATLRDKARYLNGTSSNDVLDGYSTDDIITGGDGNDTLTGNVGNDILLGGDGDDILVGDYRDSYWGLTSGNGNDTLDGGVGNDMLYGGGGNDTYIFGLGYGQDTILDSNQTSTYYPPSNGGFDTLAFQTGINPTDVTVRRTGNYDIQFSIAGTTDSVTIQNYFDSYGSGVIEQATFADGTIWDEAAIRDKARYINGTSADESIYGFNDQSDIIDAGAGNDTIDAYNGNDVIFAGAGNDTAFGSGGDDIVNGGEGDDLLAGDYYDTYWGYAYGNGSDILNGGTGNDRLYGGGGNDTYTFALGDGQDVINDVNQWSPYSSPSSGGFDTISFQTGIAPDNVDTRRVGSDLVLNINGTTDSITVQNFFDPSGAYVVEQVTFSDNTIWDESTLRSKALYVNGTAGNDTLSGYSTNDIFTGSTGNDTLYDYYQSNDTYNFAQGDGQDVIHDYGGASDTIHFSQNENQLIFVQNGSDLQISTAGSTDTVTVASWYSDSSNKIETVSSGDDASISNSQIELLIQAMASFSSQNNGISWSDALSQKPDDVQAVLSQYWTAPTA